MHAVQQAGLEEVEAIQRTGLQAGQQAMLQGMEQAVQRAIQPLQHEVQHLKRMHVESYNLAARTANGTTALTGGYTTALRREHETNLGALPPNSMFPATIAAVFQVRACVCCKAFPGHLAHIVPR